MVLAKKRDTGVVYAMKILAKSTVVKRKQVEHTKTERRVLGYTKHPNIVSLHYAFQSRSKLYFVLDYCAGGELFFHLGRLGRFKEDMACFYAAQLVLALGHLHKLKVVYRDMKPENVLLDDKGNIKIGTRTASASCSRRTWLACLPRRTVPQLTSDFRRKASRTPPVALGRSVERQST